MDSNRRSELAALVESVRSGLCREGQKRLECRYLYDEIGSELFEVICLLPEYGLTRAEERLLQLHSQELVSRLALPVMVAELGSGSCRKTRRLLEALARVQKTVYCPIEISRSALCQCRRELEQIDFLTVVGLEQEYLDGLRVVARQRKNEEHLLVLFLGSSIGNFETASAIQFLSDVRKILRSGDMLLLATDLEQSSGRLVPAYDDPIGVTAAFNLNILARLNRALKADFVLSRFRHEARFVERERRVEMHLRSLEDQTVVFHDAGFEVFFRRGETIWTESSHKYTLEEAAAMGREAGFRRDSQWRDEEWPYGLTLFSAS